MPRPAATDALLDDYEAAEGVAAGPNRETGAPPGAGFPRAELVTEVDRLCGGRVLNEGLTPADVHPLASVVRHPQNPRQGDVGALCLLIRRNGFYGRLLVQRATPEGERRMRIIAGNHRSQAAGLEGYTHLPMEFVTLSDRDALRVLLADNKASDDATNDPAALLAVLTEFAAGDDLAGTGYDGDAVDDLEALVSAPPLEQLKAEHGDAAPGDGEADPDFWPQIKLKVSPECKARFDAALAKMPASHDTERLELLLQEAGH